MCGIAGFLNYENHKEYANASNKIQYHRGPDYQDVWSQGNISLAHQRLSIIDVDPRSNQPMCKGRYVIVFNGEIYNYQQLKKKMEVEYGVTFQTNSDTEVLLELYSIKREKCLQDIIGMFSFAIFDRDKRELFIARDHFGIKPIFYRSDGAKFCFASELKTIVKTVGSNFSIDFSALSTSMQLLWLPDHYCIFKDVKKLQPGHYITVSSQGDCVTHKYWKLPDDEVLNVNETDAIEIVAKSFEESIDRHLVSDVEVGSFLSGGLDSSLVSTIAKRKLGKLKTFTIGMSDADKRIERMPDDQKYAELLASKENFDHHSIVVNPDLLTLLPNVIHSLDEPIGDPAALNTKLICKSAREMGVKVLLSGMGADEIHFGYRRQKAWLLAKKYQQLPSFVRKSIGNITEKLPVQIGGRGIRISRWAKKFLSFAELPENQSYLRSYSMFDIGQLTTLMPDVPLKKHLELGLYHDSIMNSSYQNDPINKLCQTDIKLFMSGLNLAYTDRSSMSESVEVRVPFIDRNFVETSMRMPGHFKFSNGKSKNLLKKVAERYLPKEIIYRPKSNFSVPIRSWISGELNEMVRDHLSPATIKNRGWFDSAAVQQLISEHSAGTHDNSLQIYQLLCVELWAENMVDG